VFDEASAACVVVSPSGGGAAEAVFELADEFFAECFETRVAEIDKKGGDVFPVGVLFR